MPFARSNVHNSRLKLHVLQVGVKGDCKNFNRGLDCDVLVAEVCSSLSLKVVKELLMNKRKRLETTTKQAVFSPSYSLHDFALYILESKKNAGRVHFQEFCIQTNKVRLQRDFSC